MKSFILIMGDFTNPEGLELVNSKLSKKYSDKSVSLFIDGDERYLLSSDDSGFIFAYGDSASGNRIEYTRPNEHVLVANDVLGSLPIYYFRSESLIIISNHLTVISKLTRVTRDELGVFQFVCSAYTLSDTTLYREVKQLRPGEAIEASFAGSGISCSISQRANPWRTDLEQEPSDEVIDSFVATWRDKCRSLTNYRLMMSAGWDSRTLLAGVLSSRADKIDAYSHGDIKSRELQLANQICSSHSIPHKLVELNEDLINIDLIDRMLVDGDSCMFPHWRVAAECARDDNRLGITGGIFGEIMGGHYGILSVIPQREQYKAMAAYMFGFPSKYRAAKGQTAKDIATSALCGHNYGPMWCFSDDFNALIEKELSAAYKAQISTTIHEYFDAGTTDLHRLIERFQVEHRARQYINCQLSVALPVCDIQNPFSDTTLISAAISFPVKRKLHNQLNIDIVKSLSPDLLNYSMAATLIPAKYPFVAQEASRVVRKVYERLSKYKNNEKALHLGWNNFDFLISGEFITSLIDSLSADIWNKTRMRSMFKAAHSHNIYSLYDMFLKIKTVDNRIAKIQ